MTALQTLSSCIAEYCAFDSSYCQHALYSLRQDPLDPPELPTPLVAGDSPADLESGEFVYSDYEDGSETKFEPIEVYFGDEVLPHPAYEICTPAARNIMVGDDINQMPLRPFADDPTFDFKLYNDEYWYFKWQYNQVDPACPSFPFPDRSGCLIVNTVEIIAIEAMQRLIASGMNPAIIDEMGLFYGRTWADSAPAFARLSRLLHCRFDLVFLFFAPSLTAVLQRLPSNPSFRMEAYIAEYSCIPQHGPVPHPDQSHGFLLPQPQLLDGILLSSSFVVRSLIDSIPCWLTPQIVGKIPPPLQQTPSISSASLIASAPSPCGEACFLVPAALQDIVSPIPSLKHNLMLRRIWRRSGQRKMRNCLEQY